MKSIDVMYNTTEGLKPTQGYEDDFAYDMYASQGTLIPPVTFKSIQIETDLRTAFDPVEVGMKVSLRSGIAANTPLIVSNSPGIIEGTYRDGIKIIVRNTFIDNRPVDFVFDEKGEKIPLNKVPAPIKKQARKRFEEEMKHLGYEESKSPVFKELFKTKVPCGTVYIAKHVRIAQMHFQDKISANFINKDNLPDSERGEKGLGSSGTTHTE